jgi:hypothetical protein
MSRSRQKPGQPFLRKRGGLPALVWLLFWLVCNGHAAPTNFEPLALAGQTFIHDPSTIIQDRGHYYVFGTGPGIRTKSSPDLIHWTDGWPVATK